MRRPYGQLFGLSVSLLLVVAALSPAQQPAPLSQAPEGFDKKRDKLERGKLETVEYDSKTVGAKRKLVVYLPPGYSKDTKYPVFYLLHGLGGNETHWSANFGGRASIILDNLYADRKVVPMLVVMPNGMMPGIGFGKGKGKGKGMGFVAAFEPELLKEVIPTVEARYPVRTTAEHRAVAGLSMGGGQALGIGLKHLDRFAWVGGFSSAIFGGAKGIDAEAANKKLRLLWVSCGDKDTLLKGNRAYHDSLEMLNITHIWHLEPGAHTFQVWRNDLYLFSQLLFREKK